MEGMVLVTRNKTVVVVVEMVLTESLIAPAHSQAAAMAAALSSYGGSGHGCLRKWQYMTISWCQYE
jgi:hypothetical protein